MAPRDRVLLWLAIPLLAVVACRPAELVPAPSTATTRVATYGAKATNPLPHVTLEARSQAWNGEPRDLDRKATPIWVEIENRDAKPLFVSRDTFALVAGQEVIGVKRFRPLAPRDLAPDSPDVAARELEPTTLGRGEKASGFIYFERVTGDWPELVLRATLVDAATGLAEDTLEIPFEQSRPQRCTLDRTSLTTSTIFFNTCLPPP